MLITDTNWELPCVDMGQKQELLHYAIDCGVPCPDNIIYDPDLFLEFWMGELWANARSERKELTISAARFRELCDEHKPN